MITATWYIKCNVDCPYCDHRIDILNDIPDSFEILPHPGHSEEIDAEISCPKCRKRFTVQKVEY
jgi:DNA-directed RNA polymerase subunit RPC12/RpoP